MAKSKKPDHLTQEVLAAEAAHLSYGKYKALQYEKIMQGKMPAPQATPLQTPPSGRKKFDLVCHHCGAKYTGYTEARKYCSIECKQQADRIRYRGRYNKTPKKEDQTSETHTA